MEKIYYVYELINSVDTIEYVGETYRPTYRLKQHINYNNGGQFNGRQDLIMNIVSQFNTRAEALKLERQLKIEYNLPLTEKNRRLKSAISGGSKKTKSLNHISRQKWLLPDGSICNGSNLSRSCKTRNYSIEQCQKL
jgi:predicted GIY-YIG superfamily endonuclease